MNDEKITAFLDCRGADGLSNREKIQKYQHVIRRVETTDKIKSYEVAKQSRGESVYPVGIILREGKLIGFGIEIFNEDIYPLQSFEIYLRGCRLAGRLDLSDQRDLLFVDVYHNEISAVDVSGDASLRILGLQDNQIETLDVSDLRSCQGIDAGYNKLEDVDVSSNHELVELYVNDNRLSRIDLTGCPKLKYFYCHNNEITELDTTANPLLRHLNATGNPMKRIRSLAPQQEPSRPLELSAEGQGCVGLKFNPVYDAQWKETGQWQQSYYAYPEEGWGFEGWYDAEGKLLSSETVFNDTYGASRILSARFMEVNG